MKKEVINFHGKKFYLLGLDSNGDRTYLEEASFDCGWYWGVGYVETFNDSMSDFKSHQHFNSLFLNSYIPESFKDYFVDSPLSDDEIYTLLELMDSLYTVRQYSDLIYNGSSNISSNSCSKIIKNEEEYERINEVVIPALLSDIYNLLGGGSDE